MPTYPPDLKLLPFDPAVHAPCVGLINPKSGPKKGAPILEVVARTDYFKDRIFNIVEVFKGSFKKDTGFGEDFKSFRAMLNDAKAKAIEKNDPKFRPRMFCGGGDGTASFALTIFFRIMQPDPDNGFPDTGNGFHWTDEEMAKYFPGLIQMPLGTGNDLGRAMGWGHKYPGYVHCGGAAARGVKLQNWMDLAIRVSTPIVSYDVFGFMPPAGQEKMTAKVCQLAVIKKVDGKKQAVMREADPVAPFLCFLYCSFGFIAQVVSRFENFRTNGQIQNKIMMGVKVAEILLGFRAKQLKSGMDGLSIHNLDGEPPEKNGTSRYFPPRDTRKARSYYDIGFMNANSFVGGQVHGLDRASCSTRWCLCGSGREYVNPCDGKADFFRQRLVPTIMKQGTRLQTDKKPGASFRFEAAKGQGQFMQFDGEGRFVFNPDGNEWAFDVQHVLVIPMVCNPKREKYLLSSDSTNSSHDFKICGSTPEEVARAKTRLLKWSSGELISELNATPEEMHRAGFPMNQAFETNVPMPSSSPEPPDTSTRV